MSEFGADKSAFTFLQPKDDISLFVCSIVPVREADLLGIFAGNIRFSTDVSPTHGIRGPAHNLLLDYSQVTGTLKTDAGVGTWWTSKRLPRVGSNF
ncbi:hypothetical protein AtubIFM57258_002475 [Aspergillus tubingensis]|nr:hypothetical protein AtubIFM57258_002475 [Aspergillus tubingensis]